MKIVMMNVQNVFDKFNIICDEDLVSLATDEIICVIENTATIHATSRGEFFSSYALRDFSVVKMGNNNLSKVIGKRDIWLMEENKIRLIFRDVRHILNIWLNLISIRRLDDEGLHNTFLK